MYYLLFININTIIELAIMRVIWGDSLRGGKSLFINEFKYRLIKTTGQRQNWKCATSRCHLSAITYENEVVLIKEGEHDHPDDTDKIILSCFIKIAKTMIANASFKSCFTIYHKARRSLLSNFNYSELTYLYCPIFENIKETIRTERLKHIPLAKTFDFEIPEIWRKTINKKRFLEADETIRNSRILIFLDIQYVQKFLNTPNLTVFLDGTFFSSPKFFKQIYILHIFKSNKCFPIIYCFLPDKIQSTYVRMFNLINNIFSRYNIQFNPLLFQVDFELAVINALKIVYAKVKIRGCYFHYAKAIWRNIQEYGLTRLYRYSQNFKFYVAMISIIPLIPLQFVIDSLRICAIFKPQNNENIDAFERYLNSTWFSENCRFEISIWTHCDNYGPRTNNNLEGFHSKLNRILRKAHPNFFICLNILKEIQMENEIDFKIFEISGRERPLISRYQKSHNNLMLLREGFLGGEMPLYDFMVGCIGAIKMHD